MSFFLVTIGGWGFFFREKGGFTNVKLFLKPSFLVLIWTNQTKMYCVVQTVSSLRNLQQLLFSYKQVGKCTPRQTAQHSFLFSIVWEVIIIIIRILNSILFQTGHVVSSLYYEKLDHHFHHWYLCQLPPENSSDYERGMKKVKMKYYRWKHSSGRDFDLQCVGLQSDGVCRWLGQSQAAQPSHADLVDTRSRHNKGNALKSRKLILSSRKSYYVFFSENSEKVQGVVHRAVWAYSLADKLGWGSRHADSGWGNTPDDLWPPHLSPAPGPLVFEKSRHWHIQPTQWPN